MQISMMQLSMMLICKSSKKVISSKKKIMEKDSIKFFFSDFVNITKKVFV